MTIVQFDWSKTKNFSQYLLLTIILAVILSGCVAAPNETTTSQPLPTATTLPLTITPTLKPTATPFPSLQTQGPYLVYFRELNNQKEFVFLDADGAGKKIVNLPADAQLPYLNKINCISPDGKWIAYHTGNASADCEVCSPDEKNIYLNLMDISTGETRVITPLLSDDYPANFDENAKELWKRSDIRDEYASEDLVKGEIRNAFSYGIRSLAWSPDGKYLAFAGQMMGYSSDVYLYEVETQKIRHVSSGPEEIAWIEWSPTGEWIMHGSAYWVGMGTTFTVHAAALNDATIKTLSKITVIEGIDEWLNDRTYLEHDAQNVLGAYGLRTVNIQTGGTNIVWPGSFYGYAVDVENNLILVNPWTEYGTPTEEKPFINGLYLIDLKNGNKTRLRDGMWRIGHLGIGEKRFYVVNDETKECYFVNVKGELIPTDIKGFEVVVSPDKKYMVALGNTINLYSVEEEFIRDFRIRGTDVFWRPDSSGFFILVDTNLYSVDLQNGDPVLVEKNLVNARDSGFKWVFPNPSE